MADALIRVVVQGDEAIGGISRIDQAFARLERSQPTMALRSTRRAIDELAVAATGLHPALGRVLATFAEFGIGGTTGLAAVGGFAAIGLEIKYLINYAGALDEKLLKLNTTLAQGTPAGKLLAASAAATRAEGLSKPAFFSWENLGPGDMQLASREGRLAERATAENEANLDLARFHDEHTKRLHAEANALETSNIALDRARLLTQDDTNERAKALDDLAHRADVIRLSTEQLTTADRQLILARNDEVRAIERTVTPLVKLRAEGAQIQADISHFMAQPAALQTLQAIKTPTFEQLQGAEIARQVDLGGTKKLVDQISLNLLGVGRGFTAGDTGRQEPKTKLDYGAIAASSLALVGALQQGGAGGILSAGGGLIGSLGKDFGPLGVGLTALGGVFSLFDHSQERRQKEMMAELTRIRQNTEKRDQPGRTSLTVLINGKEVSGAILDDVIYGIRRAERTNAIPVLPPSYGG